MDYAGFRAALADEALPAAVVDLDAMRRNTELLLSAMGDRVTLRVASKSIRHVGLIRRLLAWGQGQFRGLMTFSANETAFLVGHGFDDLLLAYPVSRAGDASVLADLASRGVTLLVTVDHPDHLELLETAAAAANTRIAVCLDIDASWRPMGQHFGVRRSPLRTAEQALTLAHAVRAAPHLHLRAVLAYEAQIAGIREVNPTSRHLDPIRRFIKARSRPVVLDRRRTVIENLAAAGFPIEVVNGGGTGSIQFTAEDPSVTEVTAGSGFLCPHLFDGYANLDLSPAAFFALPVSRLSDTGFVTCAGGGYPASGSAGSDRLPIVHLPSGVRALNLEGFGEVQTPMTVGELELRIGDPVICRHAKSGELAERFAEFLMVEGGEIIAREPTYRGMGECFA